MYDFGMGFWGPNGHDGVWHIALAESLARGSENIPVFSGELLKNYHIGFDLLLVILNKVTFIPIATLYFQIVPVLLAIGIGWSCYRFVYAWKHSKPSALWATFFVYFGSGWGWLVTLVRNGEIGGESMFWSQQAVSTLVNPPFALSLILMFVGFELLVRSQDDTDWISKILLQLKSWFSRAKTNYHKTTNHCLSLATFFLGLLIFVKVYAGLLVLGALFVASFLELIVWRKGIRVTKVFAGTLLLSLILFLPSLTTSGSIIVWKPFWFLETMMQISDRLNWVRFGEAMIAYRLGGIWWKAIPAYIISFLIFWYGNAGSRLFSEWYLAKRFIKRKVDIIDVMIVSIITAGILIPTFFVQSGTPWNTIQFLYYSLVFSGILAGIGFGEVHQKMSPRLLKLSSAFVLIAITIPTTLSTLAYNYVPSRPPAKVSNAEIRALDFLTNQPQGIVLTYPYDEVAARAAIDNPPRPLYLYESTAYVSAFSQHDVYLEDEVNLNITGYNWPERRAEVESFLAEKDQIKAREFLLKNDIMYIYWVGGQRAVLGDSQLGLQKIFENEEVIIYEVVGER